MYPRYYIHTYNGLTHSSLSSLHTFDVLEYAKLAMGPLWAEIMDHILPVVNDDQEDRGRTAAKLAIFSGHDTTIMMILESLGSKVKAIEWPPYASMILIEVS